MTRSRRRISVAIYFSIALSLLSLVVVVGSVFWDVGLIGSTSKRACYLSAGSFIHPWVSVEPEGSFSGFGNPGWSLERREVRNFHWHPQLLSLGDGTFHVLIIPLWPLPLLFGGCAWWLIRVRSRMARTGECPACGYSRRGLPENAPCPECGRASVVPTTAAAPTTLTP